MGIPGVLSAPQWGFYDVLFSHTNQDLALKPEDKRAFIVCEQFHRLAVMILDRAMLKVKLAKCTTKSLA